MNLKQLAKEYGVPNIRVFIELSKLEMVGLIPGFAIRNRSAKQDIVECEIIESRYKVSEGYKITLKALDVMYGAETFYQSDFESLIKHNPDKFRVYIVNIDGYQRILFT